MVASRDNGRVALLVGATGLIGRRLSQLLIGDDAYVNVHAVVRRAGALKGTGVVEHVVDFEQLADTAPEIGRVDDVFCALGTTIRKAGSEAAFRRVDQDYIIASGRLAKTLGARQFLVVSSLGADPGARGFYLRVKGETETALRKIGLAGLAIFRPSLLSGPREEFRLGEHVGNLTMGLLRPLLPQRVRPVSDVELARAMIRVARDGVSGVRIFESETIRELAAGD